MRMRMMGMGVRYGAGVALTSVLLLFVARPADAQFVRQFGGLSVGVTSSDLVGPTINTGSRSSLTAGLFTGYRFGSNSFVMIEGNWTRKGGTATRLDYVEVPLTAGLVFPGSNSPLRLQIYTGIGAAFKIGCDSAITILDCDFTNSPDWFWPLGATVVVSSGGGSIGFDARYVQGLSNAFSDTAAENRSWQFRIYLGRPVG